MSEPLMIEGAIDAGTETPARVVERRPMTEPMVAPGLDLPMAGAVFMHLVFLALVMMVPRSDGGRERSVEVYPIRLYSAAEVAEPMSGKQPAPETQPVRRPTVLPSAPAESETVVAGPIAQVREAFPEVAGPDKGGMLSESAAQVQSAGDGGSSAVTGNMAYSQFETGEIAPAVIPPQTALAAAPAGPAALPVVLAQPLYRENREPEYPPLARRRQQEGTVILEALVGADGRVAELAVHRSSGHRLLDEAALKGVKDWRFVPGRRGMTPVVLPVLVPVRFGLR